jgi:serine protease AprX
LFLKSSHILFCHISAAKLQITLRLSSPSCICSKQQERSNALCQFVIPKTTLQVVIATALIAFSSLGLQGSNLDRRAHLSADLARHQARRTIARTRVIVHGTERDIDVMASRHRLQVVKRMHGAAVVLANSAELIELSRDGAIDHLSGDLPVHGSTAISDASTAADQTRAGNALLTGLLGPIPGVNGLGIGVAVVDSGIAPHSALANRVVANVSFVSGDPQMTDAYGHGTHVAGIIAGNPALANGVAPDYAGGVAPGANLVNVRVLGADGSGLTSDVIDGIDWVVANRALYNIRVINLSLGHPVMEACATDPLCEVVNRAVQAGIVVVVAAGNGGIAPDGRTILGGISSPANSPYAITVGALNTWGTVDRSDDTVAAFSSRGPTAYDYTVKPDLAAPGTKILSLQADGAFLPTMYPSTHVAGSGNNAYMYLSGTSMAAPMVTGGVALLLQGSPNLSPAQVKLALQNGATAIGDAGLMGAGAGSVNFWASRQIAVYTASLPSAQTAPSLGSAQRFAVLGASTVTNTGSSVITGDLGVSPGTAVTGFAPGHVLSGTIHSADAAAVAAQNDIAAAYDSLVGEACTQDMTGRDLGGQTLGAGVYCFSSSAQLTGTVTLDGQDNAKAVFIFKIGSTLTTASASAVALTNGASPGNVFWQVGSSATLGTATSLAGNILALTSITLTTGARVTGRALARNGAVTLDTNAVTATGQTTSAITTTVGGVQTTGGGASFWDMGTLASHLQAGTGIHALSAADASLALADPSMLTFGDLNLLGLTNPLAFLVPKSLLYGAMAAWTDDKSIVWGTQIQDPQGVMIIWDTSSADMIIWDTSNNDMIIWDTAIMTSANPR